MVRSSLRTLLKQWKYDNVNMAQLYQALRLGKTMKQAIGCRCKEKIVPNRKCPACELDGLALDLKSPRILGH